jgi:hypothetical protein
MCVTRRRLRVRSGHRPRYPLLGEPVVRSAPGRDPECSTEIVTAEFRLRRQFVQPNGRASCYRNPFLKSPRAPMASLSGNRCSDGIRGNTELLGNQLEVFISIFFAWLAGNTHHGRSRVARSFRATRWATAVFYKQEGTKNASFGTERSRQTEGGLTEPWLIGP